MINHIESSQDDQKYNTNHIFLFNFSTPIRYAIMSLLWTELFCMYDGSCKLCS